MPDEETYYRKELETYADDLIKNKELNSLKFPLFTYPTFMDCLGLKPASPKVEILEGFVRASFDVIVHEAEEACLFAE